MVGKPYQAALTASSVRHGARWIVLSDDLPAGLVLDRDTGTITGTPTTAGSAGVTIGVSQGDGPVGAQAYTMQITVS